MKFSIQRDSLIEALSLVAGVVEKRQTLPILSNVLFDISGNTLVVTGTDMEVQMSVCVLLNDAPNEPLKITLPAKKLLDITKALPIDQVVNFNQTDESKVSVQCGKSRFTLASLPSDDFPSVEQSEEVVQFNAQKTDLKAVIDKTAFAMAQQDVRFYLNGMLWEINPTELKVVATDGHRLALSELTAIEGFNAEQTAQIIVPRKAIQELSRILSSTEEQLTVSFGHNHLYVKNSLFTFVTKLIDGKFPDYKRVLPARSTNTIVADRVEFKDTLHRASILSNEKYRGVQLMLSTNEVRIQANNPEREEAEDVVAVDYQGSSMEIGFNVNYLIDVMNIIPDEKVKISLADANSSALIESELTDASLYVVMPMRL